MNLDLLDLELHLKPSIEKAFQKEETPFSEESFTTLYLYQTAHNWKVLYRNSSIIGFIGVSYDKRAIFMPIREKILLQPDTDQLISCLVSHFGVHEIYPLKEKTARILSLKGFASTINMNDSDYLFKRDTFITYSGRSLDGKRNAIHQLFKKEKKITVQTLSDETYQDAIHILEEWNEKRAEDTTLIHERDAAIKGVIERKELGLNGWILYLNEEPKALCYGEKLSDTTYLVHCAKERNGETKGSLPFLHQEVAKAIPDSCLYINWEQDLGLLGLRKSKLSYNPTHFLGKYRITIS